MGTSPAITRWDAQGNPIQTPEQPQRPAVTRWDASGNPLPAGTATPPPIDLNSAAQALIHSRMLGVDPGFAYQQHEEIKKQLQQAGGDYWSDLGRAAETGVEETPLAMLLRGRAADPFESHDLLQNFVHDVSEIASDPVFLGATIGGSLLLGPEAGIPGAFALSAGLRKTLIDHYQKGNVKSFGELTDRAASTLWAGAKGAITGGAAVLAGGLPVPGALAGSTLARFGIHALYQSAALTTVGSLLDWRVPRMEDFTRTAVVVAGLGLLSLPSEMSKANAQRALMDVYAKDGTPPNQAAERLKAQPTVEPEAKPGLRPAIRITRADGTKGVITADEGETHPDLAERMGQRVVTIDELDKDPTLADKVLAQSEIHLQQVIDRAVQIKEEQEIEVPDKNKLQSGRGFTSPDGKFLSRGTARVWVKDNEPEVYDMWKTVVGERGEDQTAEFHSNDYAEARDRVRNRTVASGEPALSQASSDELRRINANRGNLNEIKAGTASRGYGEALRAFFVGSRNEKIALARQIAGQIRRTLPESLDRQALGIYRDYKGNEDTLRAYREAIDAGDEERLRGIQQEELRKAAAAKGKEGEVAAKEQKRAAQEEREFQKGKELGDEQLYGIYGTATQHPAELPIEKLEVLLPAIDRALEPSEGLIGADKVMTDYYTKSLDEGRRLGFLESGIPPERYFTHLLMQAFEDEAGAKPLRGGAGFTTRTPHAEERYYPTTLNALLSGRVAARTLDAADALEIYGERHGSAYAGRLFFNELRNSELAKYGTANRHPAGWVELAPGRRLFRHTVTIPGETSTEPAEHFEQSLYVPKPIADAMRPIMQTSTVMTWPGFRSLRHTQAFVKAWELSMSVFHMKALGITYLSNTELTNLGKGLFQDNDSPAFEAQERHWAGLGLETTKTSHPFEAWRALEPSALPTRGEMLRGLPGVRQLDQLAGKFTELTFDVMQRKFKVLGASQQEAAWTADHLYATDAEYSSAMRGIAKEVNAAFGGLNWEVMGWNKDMLQLARAFFLAPDWTFSNIANLKYAFEGGPGGAAARWFWFRSFTYGIAATQATSILMSGQPTGLPTKENPTKPFNVRLGLDNNGKEMYSNMYFAGAAKDAITLAGRVMKDGALTGLTEFTANKMGPLVGLGPRFIANRDWTGKPITKPQQGVGEKTLRELGFAAQTNLPIPFAATDLARMMFDPDKDWTYKDVLAELLGTYVQHGEPKQPGEKTGKFHIPGVSRSWKALAQ